MIGQLLLILTIYSDNALQVAGRLVLSESLQLNSSETRPSPINQDSDNARAHMICGTCQSMFVGQLDESPRSLTLHKSTQSLYESAEAGCFICSLYYNRVQRTARRLARDPLKIDGQLDRILTAGHESSPWQANELLLQFEGEAVTPLSFWLVPYRGNTCTSCTRLQAESDFNRNLQVLGYGQGVARELIIPVYALPRARMAGDLPDETRPLQPTVPPF